MKYLALMALWGIMASLPAWAESGDAARGKVKSAACAACHGADGNSTNAMFPRLAGQHPDYLYKALSDYKSGQRKNAIMTGQAAPLSKQEMMDLAAYYGGQKGLTLKR